MNTYSFNDLNKITEKIKKCAFLVSNNLGTAFSERVYENALFHELKKCGLGVEKQVPLKVQYDEIVVGDYLANMLVEKAVLVELKTANNLDEIYKAQCINYLKATGLKLCILINF